jgi:cation diffusion facilitator CzcD-associated flavoprotein CzcO
MARTMPESPSAVPVSPSPARGVGIVIIGGGFTGLGMGIRLRQAGIEDFEILERSNDIGGTWRDNSYPGCAVDVQSHLYSYSFAPNPDWGRVYSPREEIWAYIRRCADEFGVSGHVRRGHEVLRADWDDARQRWLIDTSAGFVEAQFLVSAMGPLSERSLPAIPGLDRFEGACFHSAAWDHDHDLAGERVAVIGTGASAAQLVPEIQPTVSRLLVFQRTPPWTFPRMNRRITRLEHLLYRRFPALQRLVRARQYWYREILAALLQRPRRTRALEGIVRLRLLWHVRDRALRRQVTPSYRMGCKRIVVSDDYHRTLTRRNVQLVTSPIREIRPSSIVTEDETEHPVDTIILATGFHPISVADPLAGRDGVTLAARWAERREAYLGTVVSGYPNYFMLVGPNTATGHTSVLLYAEAQIEYIIACLEYLHRNGLSSFDVRPQVQAAFNRDLRARLTGTVWTSGGCGSWYLDADGGTSIIWPGYTWQFRRALRTFVPDAYELRARSCRGHRTTPTAGLRAKR